MKDKVRIAFLHLDLSGGPQETNIEVLSQAIKLAARGGADWIITPETALTGYFFYVKQEFPQIPVQPDNSMMIFCELARQYGVTIFMGCPERDEKTGQCYNSCLVIGPEGQILGRHRKMHSHGGVTEGWASHGDKLEPIPCREMKAGVLICADVWFMEHSRELKLQGADVIIVPAAWPPGEHGPGDCWERSSQVSGLPVWICNQTGNRELMDMSEARSAVIVEGEVLFSYSGLQQAVLLFDWNPARRCAESTQFTVIAV